MPEMHLRLPGFTYSACRPFTKNKEIIQTFKQTGDSRYIYQNELDKVCFRHDMAYGDFKDLTRKKLLIKCCVIRHAILLEIRNMMDIKEVLLQWLTKLLIKKLPVVVLKMRIYMSGQQLAEHLYKSVIRKFKKKKYSRLLKTIFGALILLICN